MRPQKNLRPSHFIMHAGSKTPSDRRFFRRRWCAHKKKLFFFEGSEPLRPLPPQKIFLWSNAYILFGVFLLLIFFRTFSLRWPLATVHQRLWCTVARGPDVIRGRLTSDLEVNRPLMTSGDSNWVAIGHQRSVYLCSGFLPHQRSQTFWWGFARHSSEGWCQHVYTHLYIHFFMHVSVYADM